MAGLDGAEAVSRAPLVAVCVCTRGRPRMVQRCLTSLTRQKFDAARLAMRVIVVDNDPDKPSARAAYDEIYGADPSGFIHCTRPGIPMARNAAIEAALGLGADYIAFLDDDEVAPDHWLATLMQALQESGADAIQGGVRKAPPGVEDLASFAAAPSEPVSWEESESLATCNVLFKTSLVEPPLALRFDEGMQFTGGSDREFFMRAHKNGAKIKRAYGVDVYEEIAEGRTTLGYELNRAFASGNNYFTRMAKNEALPVAIVRIVLRAIASLLSGVGKLLVAALFALVFQRNKASKNWRKGCANLAFAAGCLTPAIGMRAQPYKVIQGA